MTQSSATPTHHVYLIPGLFGFGQLAGYDYFVHLRHALEDRFVRAGLPLHLEVVPAPPTASITVRARMLADTVARTLGSQPGPIHLLGHSTGGLDARVLLDPATRLPGVGDMEWRERVRSVVAMNTPHFGTPLAGYFTTAAGTRLLYLMSLLTVTSLSIGRVPLSIFADVIAAIGGVERLLGATFGPLDDLTAQVLRFVDERGRDEIGRYLSHVHTDQAGIAQLMPEVMELCNSLVQDRSGVRYGCVASASPAPGTRTVLSSIGSPRAAFKLAIYTTVYGITSHASSRYPYATAGSEQAAQLAAALPHGVSPASVDGIVPTLSMLWGELLWCGAADHLDIVGHFDDGIRPRSHVDWLRSGAGFDRRQFGAMVDAVCEFMQRD